jgi:hypothetical protein
VPFFCVAGGYFATLHVYAGGLAATADINAASAGPGKCVFCTRASYLDKSVKGMSDDWKGLSEGCANTSGWPFDWNEI